MSTESRAYPLFTRNTWTASRTTGPAIQPATLASISRLARLLEQNGKDDFGETGPSQIAFRNALLLIMNAISILGKDVLSSPVIDSEGGIRVTWKHKDRLVKLVCPATANAPVYTYHSSPPDGNSLQNQNVTATKLAERLAWLTNSAG